MANTFPLDATAPRDLTGVQLFTDQACTKAATGLTDLTGKPLSSKIDVGSDGRFPQFLSTATVLYWRSGGGTVRAMYPHPSATVPTVTGSKGANAALTSLVAALAAEGLIVDTTT